MDEVQEQFDDPMLKRALQRAVGKTPAPAALRDKVAAMMATTPATSTLDRHAEAPKAERSWWRIPRIPARIAAAAAVMLVAVGFAFVQVAREFELFSSSSGSSSEPAKFEEPFARAMVDAHRKCSGVADHHLVAGNDFTALRTELSKVEGINVFAAKLGDDWQFKGAGICDVGDKKAAHLLFTRGEQTASVFSIPQSEHACADTNYEELFDNSAILGFTKDNALYTIVVTRTDGKASKAKHCKALLEAVHSDVYQCAPLIQSAPTQPAQ
jgi:hypothetical protein